MEAPAPRYVGQDTHKNSDPIPVVQAATEAPAPRYVGHLLRQDFKRTCAKVRYCFDCETAFCLDCCSGHSALHHSGHPCRIAQVKVVRDVICVREEDVAGIGYNWRTIQKFKDIASGNRFIPLRRNILQGRLGIYCENCNDRMYLRSRHCCTACRLQNVVTGGSRGRSKVTALVQTQFSQKAVLDSFCTICSRLFSSSCCSDHLMRHHPEEKGAVLRLVRHMDSIFAPVVDVVGSAPPILAGIQTFMVNGMAMVPLFRSGGHPEPEGEIGNSCGRCFKAISIDSYCCCLQCRAEKYCGCQN